MFYFYRNGGGGVEPAKSVCGGGGGGGNTDTQNAGAHLMPVEQGLPWHPVATGLTGQAIPFVVAASHAHALPSAPFWFPVPAVLVASPALLCPSSLSAVLALVPLGVVSAGRASTTSAPWSPS